MSVEFKLDNVKVVDIEIDGINMKDYPDFCDSYISDAYFTNGTQLTDEQLVDLQEQNPEAFGEAVFDTVLGICDRHYS